MDVRIGVGGIVPEWKKPQFSISSTKKTIARHLNFMRFLSGLGFRLYAPMPVLLSKQAYKKVRASQEAMLHKDDYVKLGEEMRKMNIVGVIECSKYACLGSKKDYVIESAIDEIIAHAYICNYTKTFKNIVIHAKGEREILVENVRNLPTWVKKILCLEFPERENAKRFIKLCDECSVKPLADIGHIKLLGNNYVKDAILTISDYWDKYMILHYSNVDKRGKHVPLCGDDFLKALRILEKVDKDIWIVIESPRETRIKDGLKAMELVLENSKKNRREK
ncbi:MAG: hypothetical protein B6U95_00415 [Thermofilum sp. ex4484_82]|nr:MAG: hypothetical protein B6U95_00415 [Thermofilum sp. ex4484_82]